MFKIEKDITERDIIEFYVDLIDEKEADNILNVFNEKVTGFSKQNPNLNLKKNYIKKIFRKQTAKTRKIRSNAMDPFAFYCQRYKDLVTRANLDEKEYKQLLYDISFDKINTYKMFLSVYVNQPNHTLSLFPKIKENFGEDRDIFDFGFQLNSLEEIRDYTLKTNKFMSEDSIEIIIKMLDGFFSVEESEEVTEIEKQVKNLNLLNFNQKKNFFLQTKKYQQHCMDFAYIRTHKNKEDKEILIGLSYNIIETLLRNFKDNIKKLQEELINKYIKKDSEYEKVLETIEKTRKELDENIKTIDILSNENKNLQEKIIEQDQQNEIYIEKIKAEFQERIKELGIEKDLKDNSLNDYDKSCKITINIKELKQDLGQEELENFLIIIALENKMIKTLFPEVQIYTLDKWYKDIEKINTKNIKNIYIQREGISSNDIFKIKEYSHIQNIKGTIFSASSDKKLIEKIGYFKNII